MVEAKGIDKNDIETPISNYTAVLPDDALGVNAYDGKTETNVEVHEVRKLNVSSELYEQKLRKLFYPRAWNYCSVA